MIDTRGSLSLMGLGYAIAMGKNIEANGFTLIELMVVVSIVAIFAAMALPGFSSLIARERVSSAKDDLFSLIQFARLSAAQSRRPINICSDADRRWEVKRKCEDNEGALRTLVLPRIKVLSSKDSVEFRGDGSAIAPVDIVLCKSPGAVDGYKIQVQASGFTIQSGLKEMPACVT